MAATASNERHQLGTPQHFPICVALPYVGVTPSVVPQGLQRIDP